MTKRPSKKRSEFLAVHVEPGLRKQIEAAAAADARSVSSFLRYVVTDFLADRSPDAGDRQARA
jgi:uncharacterized protein (DUF1778 family)